ncbi:MAG: D-lyxose/D-mannose family sugar isomerase [Opitutaceae bacterium]
MIKRSEYARAQRQASDMIRQAGIQLTEAEAAKIDVVDFGLSQLAVEGVQVFTMFATDRISAKVLVMFPNQTEPEHWHPPVGNDPGKEETIRVISGTLHFYIPGPDTLGHGWVPAEKEACYTCRHEIVMQPCDQLTLPPGTKHWFQAPESGAVFYSFSTCVRDGLDRFTDPAIVRQTQIEEDLPVFSP